ncbi:Forkhead box protein O-like Protein [Tribolium castaneum]|uniref:Forkhead box protein O-like Protein n=1 Tax=Tribolium castaneum TaxID=7070 RepID=A0A139WN76_TRICA|nr:Forkhead box protein O-like Protein [Tribolium castaneum]
MSPAGMSPSYPHSEPSPDPLNSQYLINRSTMPRPPSSSPPLTPQPSQGTPSTMMGQLMGALNNSTVLDDLNINVESFQGGFDCNVEELIKHELTKCRSTKRDDFRDHQHPSQRASTLLDNGNDAVVGALTPCLLINAKRKLFSEHRV